MRTAETQFQNEIASLRDPAGYYRKVQAEIDRIGPAIHDGLGEIQHFGQRMTVVNVLLMVRCGNDDSVGFTHGYRSLAAEFVFSVLLAFGDAVDLRFVQGVDLVFVFGF